MSINKISRQQHMLEAPQDQKGASLASYVVARLASRASSLLESSPHSRRRRRWHTPPHHLRRRTANSVHGRRAKSDGCHSRCPGHRRGDGASTSASRHARSAWSQSRTRRRRGRSLHGQTNHVLPSQDDQTQRALLLPLFDDGRPISLLPEGAEFLRVGQDQIEMLVKGQECADDDPAILQRYAEPMLHVAQEF